MPFVRTPKQTQHEEKRLAMCCGEKSLVACTKCAVKYEPATVSRVQLFNIMQWPVHALFTAPFPVLISCNSRVFLMLILPSHIHPIKPPTVFLGIAGLAPAEQKNRGGGLGNDTQNAPRLLIQMARWFQEECLCYFVLKIDFGAGKT